MTPAINPSECPRAFKVSDDEYSTVVYARNPMEARRLASAYELFCCAEEQFLDVERAPQFDCLNGKTLMVALMEDGWRWECANCYSMVGLEDGAVIVDDVVYCSDHKPRGGES